jgi:hypothetical protein
MTNWITEAREAHQAATVPLVEKLRSVPCDAVLRIDTPNALGCMDTRSIPVGRLCHEAADALSECRAVAGVRVRPEACTADCRWPACTCGVGVGGGGQGKEGGNAA